MTGGTGFKVRTPHQPAGAPWTATGRRSPAGSIVRPEPGIAALAVGASVLPWDTEIGGKAAAQGP